VRDALKWLSDLIYVIVTSITITLGKVYGILWNSIRLFEYDHKVIVMLDLLSNEE
jgi:hypothetical protein